MTQQETTIKELTADLIVRAKSQFPSLEIEWGVSSITGETICRIIHHKAIDGEHQWVAIVPLTSRWTSDKGETAIRINTTRQTLEIYDSLVDHALDLELFKIDSFSVVGLAT